MIAFDDGPLDTTEAILDVLNAYAERATFFVNGKNFPCREHVLQRMVAEGHEIGNHGYSHRALVDDSITLPEVLDEISRNHDAIQAATGGYTPTKFRTPFVRWSHDVHVIAQALGYDKVYAAPSFGDYNLTAAEIVHAASFVGDDIWLHDGHWPTVEALPAILEARAR